MSTTDDLQDSTKDYIASLIKQGYTSGFIQEEDFDGNITLTGTWSLDIEINKSECYYQPVEFKDTLYSFEVYRSFKKCQEDFPGVQIIKYTGDDIEERVYRD